MTEVEWLSSDDLLAMTNIIREPMHFGRFGERVRRLFSAACARHVWNHLVSDRSRAAVELSERAADHPVPERDLSIAAEEADDAVYDLNGLPEKDPRIWAAYTASYGSSPHLDIDRIFEVGSDSGGIGDGGMKAVADLLRDVTGNPFRPTSVESIWLTATVTSIAQVAYDQRSLPSGHLDPNNLAVLADALEDAGCTSEQILSHLRSPWPHVRGCWVLDLLLCKF
jgi:hypothetical protein